MAPNYGKRVPKKRKLIKKSSSQNLGSRYRESRRLCKRFLRPRRPRKFLKEQWCSHAGEGPGRGGDRMICIKKS
jgi:hypothetical protein